MNNVASFPMYDLPEVRDALDSLWSAVSRALAGDAPAGLVHGEALGSLWTDQALFVSQCCGYDLVNRYAGILRPLVTPRYTAPGCRGTDYCSQVMVAKGSAIAELSQARGGVCAVNGLESHSGMNALRALVAPLQRGGRFFARVAVCGTHAESLAAVASGAADLCAIDCVTHALLARHRRAALDGTRILCQTDPAPGVPFITRVDRGDAFAARLQAALLEVIGDPELSEARRDLLIGGGEIIPLGEYDRIREFESQATAGGYPRLS